MSNIKLKDILKENALQDIKKDVERLFDISFEPHIFKFNSKDNLIGINIEYLSSDTSMDPNDIVSAIRGLIRKNSSKYSEIKMAKGGGLWPKKLSAKYSSLEKMDPDSWMVIKIK